MVVVVFLSMRLALGFFVVVVVVVVVEGVTLSLFPPLKRTLRNPAFFVVDVVVGLRVVVAGPRVVLRTKTQKRRKINRSRENVHDSMDTNFTHLYSYIRYSISISFIVDDSKMRVSS